MIKRFGCAFLLAAAIGVAAPLHAQKTANEDELKAAFLFNFAKYVTWPPKTFPDGKFRICVVSDTAFARKVGATVEGETLDGRAVISAPMPSPESIARTCNILFIGANESGRSAELLAAVREAGVLTVGETESFAARGGMITFLKDGDRLRFDINQTEARRAGLTISSRLLRLAWHVDGALDPR